MNEPNLVRETPDWDLPIKHELYWSSQFLQPGRTFIDIGAHVGTWTLRLAPLFERVFAFEPDPRGYEALRKNIDAAGLKNVEVIGKAVSDTTGTAKLTLTPNPCTNTMLWTESERTDERFDDVEVPTVALDDFVEERGITDIDLIKVDAEGAEMLIVAGARETILTQRPDLFIEMHGLFHKRLRRLLDPIQMDMIDGGRAGMSLMRHRHSGWPGLPEPHFKVYPHGTSPTLEQLEELRRFHGIPWTAPRTGWLSEDGQ